MVESDSGLKLVELEVMRVLKVSVGIPWSAVLVQVTALSCVQ
jgi:hypothetical protein